MVYKKRLPYGDDFSDSDTSDGDIREITPPSIVVKSPEKLDSKHVATETSNMFRSRKKRKATLANYLGPSPKRLWSENDELVILKVSTLLKLLFQLLFCSSLGLCFHRIFDIKVFFCLFFCFNSSNSL